MQKGTSSMREGRVLPRQLPPYTRKYTSCSIQGHGPRKPTRGFQLANLFTDQGAWVLSPQGCFFLRFGFTLWLGTYHDPHTLCRERAMMDVRVFNPFAPSNSNSTLDSCFTKHEREKTRAYGRRVREVEHATFVPLVMSATGGLAKHATNFYKRLASLLADKWTQPYSSTLYWLRCSLSFSLLR